MQPEDVFIPGGTEVCTTEKRGRNIKVTAGEEATAPCFYSLPQPWSRSLMQMLGKPISLSVLEQLCFSWVRWLSDSLGTGSVSGTRPTSSSRDQPESSLWIQSQEGQSWTWYSQAQKPACTCVLCSDVFERHNSEKTPSSWYQHKARASPWFTNLIHTVSWPLFHFVSSLFFFLVLIWGHFGYDLLHWLPHFTEKN